MIPRAQANPHVKKCVVRMTSSALSTLAITIPHQDSRTNTILLTNIRGCRTRSKDMPIPPIRPADLKAPRKDMFHAYMERKPQSLMPKHDHIYLSSIFNFSSKPTDSRYLVTVDESFANMEEANVFITKGLNTLKEMRGADFFNRVTTCNMSEYDKKCKKLASAIIKSQFSLAAIKLCDELAKLELSHATDKYRNGAIDVYNDLHKFLLERMDADYLDYCTKSRQTLENHGLLLNSKTFLNIIEYYIKTEQWKKMLGVLSDMLGKKIRPTYDIYQALMYYAIHLNKLEYRKTLIDLIMKSINEDKSIERELFKILCSTSVNALGVREAVTLTQNCVFCVDCMDIMVLQCSRFRAPALAFQLRVAMKVNNPRCDSVSSLEKLILSAIENDFFSAIPELLESYENLNGKFGMEFSCQLIEACGENKQFDLVNRVWNLTQRSGTISAFVHASRIYAYSFGNSTSNIRAILDEFANSLEKIDTETKSELQYKVFTSFIRMDSLVGLFDLLAKNPKFCGQNELCLLISLIKHKKEWEDISETIFTFAYFHDIALHESPYGINSFAIAHWNMTKTKSAEALNQELTDADYNDPDLTDENFQFATGIMDSFVKLYVSKGH